MPVVTYEGPHGEVHLAELRLIVKQGDSVEVSSLVAKELVNSGFVVAKSKKANSEEEK